jgi:hypothetical protein
MDEKAIYEHLSGKQTVGLYPLLPDNNCFLLAVDFDKSDWKMDQVNLTDDESRIIAASGGDFEQAYNAQASVDSCSGLIITKHVTQATNDKLEVTPNLAALAEMESVLGKVAGLLADTGDFWFVDSRSYLRNGIWLASGSISSSCSVWWRKTVKNGALCSPWFVQTAFSRLCWNLVLPLMLHVSAVR